MEDTVASDSQTTRWQKTKAAELKEQGDAVQVSKSTIVAAIGQHRSEAGAGSPIQPWPWCWRELTPANTPGLSRMQLLLQPQPQSELQV